MMISEIKRKKLANEVEKYYWSKHNLNRYIYYEWEKYGLNNETTYYYNKYALENNVTATSSWNKYELDGNYYRVIQYRRGRTNWVSSGYGYMWAMGGNSGYAKYLYHGTSQPDPRNTGYYQGFQIRNKWGYNAPVPQAVVRYIPPVTKQEYDAGNHNVVVIDDRNQNKKMLVSQLDGNDLFYAQYALDYSVLSNSNYFDYKLSWFGPVCKYENDPNVPIMGFGMRDPLFNGGQEPDGSLDRHIFDYSYCSQYEILQRMWEEAETIDFNDQPGYVFMFIGDNEKVAYSDHIYSVLDPYITDISNGFPSLPQDCLCYRDNDGKLIISGVFEWSVIKQLNTEKETVTSNSFTTTYGIQYQPFHQNGTNIRLPLTTLTKYGLPTYLYYGDDETITEAGKGEFIETVEATNERNKYPDNGIYEQNWYEYITTTYDNQPEQGALIGEVSTEDNTEYPANGINDIYWYEYTRSTTKRIKGSYLGKVQGSTDSVYPSNGISGNYYYIFNTQYQIGTGKGEYIGFVKSTTPSTYPEDGLQDGYWYSRIDTSDNMYPVWDDTNLLGGISYIQNINPSNDYIIGPVGSASIEFLTLDKSDVIDGAKYYYYSNLRNLANGLTLKGIFNITECEKQDRGSYKITAFDDLCLFDKFIDDWLFNTVQFPITVENLYHQLCSYVGASYYNRNITNRNYQLEDTFEGTNITGKMLLQYIAEMCGGFVYVTADGKVDIKTYTTKNISLNNTTYTKVNYQDYSTPAIGKVIVKQTDNDVGTISGTGDVAYTIVNNPLFYVDEVSQSLTTAIGNIYNTVHTATYVPGEVELQDDLGINCGDIITVDNQRFYVMEKNMSSSGVKLLCFGQKNRDTNTSLNTEIMALRGKTNELVRTVEETRSTLTDITEGLRSEIRQTASSISTLVENEVAEQTSSIVQTANSISSTVQAQGQTITQIRQDLNGISLTYNSQNGTASITIGDVTVSNLVDGNYVQQVVAGININGYVTFSNLATSGQTVINGDNITTGTIDAARINMTGAISWGDLDYSCQGTIVSLAGQDGQDGVSPTLPAYIQATYIDSTNIYSPNIYGAHIYAGTSTSGYMSMSSTGMNFVSASGTPLVGIGYYSGNYLYPYIVLGQGVDGNNTDQGMVKKYSNGIWIGDSDGMSSSTVGQGTGLFVDFNQGKIYKYVNGTATELGGAS